MGKFFSDEVEKALCYIYYDLRAGRGAEGYRILEKASEAGDGDASCILARCLCGTQYVWGGHDFPEDDDKAVELMHKAVEQGSAIGVLLALRSGELKPDVKGKMTFSNLQEAFEVVLEKAQEGDPFCQYTVGNVYFWWDFVKIQNIRRHSFPNEAAYKACMRENISKCEDWFWKALRGGMYFAANNLNRYYTQGDEDLIAPQPEKAKDIYKIGAELGSPILQYIHGDNLMEQKREAEALEWYRKAAEGGQFECWYILGNAYEKGKLVPKDPAEAARCYEKGLMQKRDTSKKVGCANCLGALYYEGQGVYQDYDRAFNLLHYAWEHGSTWGVCYLGKCYYRGWGTEQDFVKAREFLEKVNWVNKEAYYMLGTIYGQGLGTAPDIEKGVQYLKKAGDYQEASAELKKYKKTLFGKWVRR